MNARLRDLGRMAYGPALEVQLEAHAEVLGGGPDTLLLVEHEPVLTLGASFHEDNLLFSEEEYAAQGIEVVRTDRGGDVTYHGPGQLTLYPIFHLERHGKDLHAWMRRLEGAMLRSAGEFGVVARRFPPHTGAWAGDEKFAAIGVKVRKWVSLHGIGLNVGPDLTPFSLIVPCGIRGYGVTSLSLAAGREVGLGEAKAAAVRGFEAEFGVRFGPLDSDLAG